MVSATGVVAVLVDEAVALAVHEHALAELARGIPDHRDEALVHVDGGATRTDAHQDTAAHVAGTADRCCIAQARRVLVDHFPVHDETAATQHHTTAGVPGALLAVLPAEHSDHSFVLADQGQCAGVVMHLDSGALDRPGERCHQGCTAFFPEGFGLVRAWRGAGRLRFAETLLVAGICQ